EERRVIEERLHEKQILAEQAAELLHRVEHPAEEPEPRADLTRGEPGSHGPTLLGKVPGQRAEERVLSVLVPIDAEPPRGRIGDLDEGKLGDPEGAHLDVDEDDRIAIVARGAELDPRPALLGRRVDPEEAMPDLIETGRPVDPEAGADVRGDEPPVE